MMLCLVTDRRRRAPVEQAREAADAGVDIIHVREPDLEAAELAALVSAIVDVTRGSRTRVVVNDRLDVALACGAAGVHLREESMAAVRVRAIAPASFLIGRSIHSEALARESANAADYVIAGTVFPTRSKPGLQKFLGLDGLAHVVAALQVPVLAIGGMSVDRVSEVAKAGAAGLAAIGLFADAQRPIKEVVEALRERFKRDERV